MTIPLLASNGLFTRWGVEISASNQVQALIDQSLNSMVSLINSEYSVTDANVLQAANSNLAALQQGLQSDPQPWLQGMQAAMQNTVIQMYLDDGGVLPVTLGQALTYLIGQMNVGGYAAAASIKRPTISESVTHPAATIPGAPANVGNGTILVSLTDTDGRPLDYVLAEVLTVVCTGDGYTGGTATAGSEPFQITGALATDSIYAYNYPQGSGATATISTLNPALTSGLVVTDGDFEQWTVNTPDDWPISVGAAQITKGVSPYTGSTDLLITGDNTTLVTFSQQVTLEPNTVYAFSVYMKKTSTPTGTIAFTLSSTTAAAGVFADNAGNNNNISVDVAAAVTSSYALSSGFFRTPAVLPTNTYLVAHMTTALSGSTLAIDTLGLQSCQQVYPGGPWVAAVRGSTNFAAGDSFSIAVVNNATLDTFPLQLARYMGLVGVGAALAPLKFPSAGSPTISNSLISGVFPAAPATVTIVLNGDNVHVDFTLSAAQTGAVTYSIYSNGAELDSGLLFSDLNPGPFQVAPGSGSYGFQLASVDSLGNVSALSPAVGIKVP